MNALYYGDNLDVLRRHVKDETVDLVYLDPPFNSNATYNVLFDEQDGTRAAAQIKAFEDTWRWDEAAALAYQEVVEHGPTAVGRTLKGLRDVLGDAGMTAYLAMMAPRLTELRRVMASTATLYLHCDPTASHYLKVLLDAVFGPKNFRNEVIWCYAGGGIPAHDLPRKHDTILRYTKTDDYYYKPEYRAYSAGTLQRGRTKVKGKYFDKGLRAEGTPINDWWTDVPKITSPTDPEKLGYPTQKPEALLERIINLSSQEGDVVLDPFCGCGTAIAVAQRLGRNWVGIDITHLAVSLMKHRLTTQFGDAVDYKVVGEPATIEDSRQLSADDKYQFQWWALGLVGARPTDQRKGADRGIDGQLFFHDEGPDGKTKQIIFSVKGGHTSVKDIRDLGHVVSREGAQIGVLISLEPPTKPMRTEAAGTGFYLSPWTRQQYPRLQIRTIEELLAGNGVAYPAITGGQRTFRPTARAHRSEGDQGELGL